jgi:aminomethyltransferase
MPVQETPFVARHRRHNAKLIDFAGYLMPIQYTGIVEEHRRVRSTVGVFDVSHMGEVAVRGRDALAFVQSVTINDASKLVPGRVQYSAMCYDDGGIVDDLLVYHMGDHYMLVINAANTEKDLDWLRAHRKGQVELDDLSARTALLAVQGPRALDTLRSITDVDLEGVPYYHWVRGRVAGIPAVISRTGYTGELGFELYTSAEREGAERLWDALLQAGKEYDIAPVGLGARDTLRLEMGFCLYGHDIDQTTNPIAAGLSWITKVDKGEFVGKGPIGRMKKEGPARKLIGFVVDDRAVPRQGYPLHAGGRPVGVVTSGNFSPTLEKNIGMGYVEAAHAKPGGTIAVLIRNREVPATVTALPFLKK